MSIIRIKDFNISSISNETTFVLDTNILYYVHSGYYIPSERNYLEYSNLIQQLITNDCCIRISSLSIQELLFGVENKEYRLYLQENSLNEKRYTKKDYRKNEKEKKKIHSKLNAILMELSLYEQDDSLVSMSFIKDYVNTFETHHMDPIDYIISCNYDCSKTIFITNDKDFQSISNINILTI